MTSTLDCSIRILIGHDINWMFLEGSAPHRNHIPFSHSAQYIKGISSMDLTNYIDSSYDFYGFRALVMMVAVEV